MKTILWVSGVILTIILASLYVNSYLQRSAAELSQQLEKVQQLVREGQWAAADTAFQQANAQWKDVCGTWSAIIRHQEIDEIEKTFGKITQFIVSEDRSMALAELETAKLLVEHIPEKEKITIANIL